MDWTLRFLRTTQVRRIYIYLTNSADPAVSRPRAFRRDPRGGR